MQSTFDLKIYEFDDIHFQFGNLKTILASPNRIKKAPKIQIGFIF